MKVCIIVGTRPEIIKMSPVIHECIERKIDYFIIHSNQHYSPEMDEVFFEELSLPSPKYNLNVGSGKHSNQTGNILIKMEPILEDEKPDFVLVQGDTNTVIAGALAASKLNIKTCHIEAGLRSYDRTMPEETNRIVTDHLSTYQFAVSQTQKDILLSEGSTEDKVFIVGNTITDAVFKNIEIAKSKSDILSRYNLNSKSFVLLTAHRSSNVDTESAFKELLDAIKTIPQEENILWPIHPRARKTLDEFKLEIPKNITLINPTGYLDFLVLQSEAKFALTDSGGVQEECCILGTPCMTLRENTERPETIVVGANRLVGRNSKKIAIAYDEIVSTINKKWLNPFGDGTSSKQILNVIQYGKQEILETNTESITVIGLGYMGLPMACLLANADYNVFGVDINADKVKEINSGNCPFDETGMDQLLYNALTKKFIASTELKKSSIYIISVPTPEKNKKCDLTFIEKACEQLTDVIEEENLIIIESTIKPGTCSLIFDKYFAKLGKNIHIAHCPERAIPGNTLHELVNNDRLVGGLTEVATEKAYNIYKSFVTGNVFKTDAKTAECCKLMENTYRDVNIALANELDNVLSQYGVNSIEAIKFANKHPRVNILSPGPGVGGHCIAIDPWFLTEDTDQAKLIKMSREINDLRPKHWGHVIKKVAEENNYKRIGILGVAYKKNVDDARETPSLKIYEELSINNFEIKASDPYVKSWDHQLYDQKEVIDWSDLIVICCNHDNYININTNKKTINTFGASSDWN